MRGLVLRPWSRRRKISKRERVNSNGEDHAECVQIFLLIISYACRFRPEKVLGLKRRGLRFENWYDDRDSGHYQVHCSMVSVYTRVVQNKSMWDLCRDYSVDSDYSLAKTIVCWIQVTGQRLFPVHPDQKEQEVISRESKFRSGVSSGSESTMKNKLEDNHDSLAAWNNSLHLTQHFAFTLLSCVITCTV